MLKVDTKSTIPIYIQIREQIKNLVFKGDLQAHAALPSVNLLSQNLQVNRNTVLRAYRELRDEGFVTFHSGKGTFVAEHPPASAPTKTNLRSVILEQTDHLIREAITGGMDKAELTSLLIDRVQAYTEQNPPPVRAAFIECNVDRLKYYTDELARELKIEVQPLLLSDLHGNGSRTRDLLGAVDFVIVPFFHLAEARQALRKLVNSRAPELLAITIRPHLDVIARLAKVPKGSKVAIMYFHQDSYTAGMMNNMLQLLQRLGLPIELVPIYVYPDQTNIAERLTGFDVVVVQPENIRDVAHLIPNQVQLIEWANILDEASVAMLREIAGQIQDTKGRNSKRRDTR